MRVEQAVAEIQKLSGEMNEAAEKATASSTRYEAHLSLYNVACMQGDAKEIEVQRLAVISQVENLLDASYDLYTRRRKIQDIQRNVT
jgi:hypothetical protein